jgi:hypothetical protein
MIGRVARLQGKFCTSIGQRPRDKRMVKIINGERVCKHARLGVGCSAAVLDSTGQKMLLIRRSDNGRWAVPGGYMEPGESFVALLLK